MEEHGPACYTPSLPPPVRLMIISATLAVSIQAQTSQPASMRGKLVPSTSTSMEIRDPQSPWTWPCSVSRTWRRTHLGSETKADFTAAAGLAMLQGKQCRSAAAILASSAVFHPRSAAQLRIASCLPCRLLLQSVQIRCGHLDKLCNVPSQLCSTAVYVLAMQAFAAAIARHLLRPC